MQTRILFVVAAAGVLSFTVVSPAALPPKPNSTLGGGLNTQTIRDFDADAMSPVSWGSPSAAPNLATGITPAGGATPVQHQYIWSPRYTGTPVCRDNYTPSPANAHSSSLNAAHYSTTGLTRADGGIVNRCVNDVYGGVHSARSDWSTFELSSTVANTILRWQWYYPRGLLSRDPAGDANLQLHAGDSLSGETVPSGLAAPLPPPSLWPTSNGVTTTPSDPNVSDRVENYWNLGTGTWGFDLILDFLFPPRPAHSKFAFSNDAKYNIPVDPQTKKPLPRAKHKVSNYGNSGVYVFNAIEVQIIDQNAITATGTPARIGGQLYYPYPTGGRFSPEAPNTLVTGVAYGVGDVPFTGDHPTNNLRPDGQWNRMEITFIPLFGLPEPQSPANATRLIGGWLTVTVNGKFTYAGPVPPATGSRVNSFCCGSHGSQFCEAGIDEKGRILIILVTDS